MIDNNVDFLNNEPETETEEVEQEVSEQTEQEQPVQAESPREKDQKQSWKELREKAAQADQLQRERDEYYMLLKQMAEAAQKQNHDDFDINSMSDDELADVKLLKKVVKKQETERQALVGYLQQQQQQQQEITVTNELRAKYGDFDDVLNRENIIKLRDLRPGLARTLHQITDTREKAIETYHTIKDLGIYENNSYPQERNRIQQNVKKPRSINSVADKGNDPLNYAAFYEGGLTEDMKRKIYNDTKKKAGLD